MNRQLPLRQRIRKAPVILTFLSFPITMNYLMENPECILCGTCVDNCVKQAIRYSFSSGK